LGKSIIERASLSDRRRDFWCYPVGLLGQQAIDATVVDSIEKVLKIDVQYMTLTYMEHSIPLYVAPLHKAGNAWLEANKPLEFTHNAS
ncbi:hypothetical protein V2R93_23645, partial [Escherichia coli]|uniref:hypothetical protein n=1 Tax=Escherichia coli TaxID=562 RepID=UPI002ED456D5|nr:hypothetical protein [Escherichia coli]